MARHEELDEVAGTKPYQYTATPDTMQGRNWMTNISRVLDNMISKAGYGLSQTPTQDVDESKIHELDLMINQHMDRRHPVTDPENLGPWPFRKGPEDYPEPNEG